MEKIGLGKQLDILKRYFSGSSYDDIALQAGVSKGTVANVVKDLKAGQIPEAADLAEQVEALRELSGGIKQAHLSIGEAVAGGSLLSHLLKLGITPGEIELFAATCKRLAPSGTDAAVFVRAAMSLERLREHFGLSVEDLENKVHDLEEKAALLGPAVLDMERRSQEIPLLEKQRHSLSEEASAAEKRLGSLREEVASQEKREAELSRRVRTLEDKAQAADERLASARRDLQALAAIGLPLDDLTGITHRVSTVAQRHGIKPEALRDRLLHELETLEAGLQLEALVETRQRQLGEIEEDIDQKQREHLALDSALGQLRQGQATLHASIKEEQEQIGKEMAAIAGAATDAGTRLQQDLARSIAEAVREVQKLRDQALEAGKELGRFETTIEANQWLKTMAEVVKGNPRLKAAELRPVALSVLRGLKLWLRENQGQVSLPYSLSTYLDSAIGEMERWKA